MVYKGNVFFCEKPIDDAFERIFADIKIMCGEPLLEYKGDLFSKDGA